MLLLRPGELSPGGFFALHAQRSSSLSCTEGFPVLRQAASFRGFPRPKGKRSTPEVSRNAVASHAGSSNSRAGAFATPATYLEGIPLQHLHAPIPWLRHARPPGVLPVAVANGRGRGREEAYPETTIARRHSRRVARPGLSLTN